MNKVTAEFLESEIVEIEYRRGKGTLTHCYITVKGGFVFTGESACINESEFKEDVGQALAYDNAFEKMWAKYGFLLHRKYCGTHIERMQNELDELFERLNKLSAFLDKSKPDFLDENEWALLHEQRTHMTNYFNVLNMRLDIAKSKEQKDHV